MCFTKQIFILACTVLALAVPGRSAPIVLNASFELDVLSSPFFGNAGTVQNWTHGGPGDGPHWAIGYSDGGGSITTAGAGNQFVTMGGGGTVGTGTWSQTVSGFTVNQQYILSFMLAGEVTSDNSLVTAEMIGIGTTQQNFAAPPSLSVNYWRTWQTFNMQFTADSITEQIFFTSTTIHDVGLDNVGISLVTGTPEPATWGMLSAGLAALACGFIKTATAGLALCNCPEQALHLTPVTWSLAAPVPLTARSLSSGSADAYMA